MAKAKKKKVTKVQLVDENGVTPKAPMFEYLLKLIPLFLLFGTIYQMWALYSVWKIGALSFFSWSQVINDTVIIMPFTAVIVGSSWIWAWMYRVILSVWEDEACAHKKYFVKSALVILVYIVTAAAFSIVEIFFYSEWQISTVISSSKVSAEFYFSAFLITLWYSSLFRGSDEPVKKFIAVLCALVMSWFWLHIAFPILQNVLASNWCSWKWDQYTPIEYMNDKYFFSSWAILSDSWAATWARTVVYARSEEDKFTWCPLQNRTVTQPGSKK